MRRYTVWFGDQHVTVQLDENTIVEWRHNGEICVLAKDYIGRFDELDGLRGGIVFMAVKKLFGKNCYWRGNPPDRKIGEVFDWWKGWNITDPVVLKCTYQEKGKTVNLF